MCPNHDQLKQFLAGESLTADEAAISLHISDCSNCQKSLDQLTTFSTDSTELLSRSSIADSAFFKKLKAMSPGRDPKLIRGLPSISGYEVLAELGRGGTGVVFKAHHIRLNRLVALKIVLAGRFASSNEMLRFHIEAEAIATLNHPNIVQVYEVGESEGCPYLALAFIDGGTLAGRIKEGPVPSHDAAMIIHTLALAVDYAHRRGVIHRDLKPTNVLLTVDGQPRIADFGLAKRLHDERHHTATGDVLGTPSYMAPEQASSSREIGPAVDIYALGAILYDLLTAKPPFSAETPVATLLDVLHREPTPPSSVLPGIPRDLETICLKCLQKKPNQRYASAFDLAEDLQRFIHGEPIKARSVGTYERTVKWMKRRPMAAALLIMSVLAVVAMIVVFVEAVDGIRLRKEYERVDHQRQEVEIRKSEVERQKEEIEEMAGRVRYVKEIARIQAALEGEQLNLAQQMLKGLIPTSNRAGKDRRGFEWYHLLKQCHGEREIFVSDYGKPVEALALNPDGSSFVYGGQWGTYLKLNTSPYPIRLCDQWTTTATYSPNGKVIATTTGTDQMNCRLMLWDAINGKEISLLSGPKNIVTAVAFNHSGKTLALAHLPKEISIWDVDTSPFGIRLRTRAKVLPSESISMDRLIFSPDGKIFIATDAERNAGVYDSQTGAMISTIRAHEGAGILSASFSPDGRFLAIAQGYPFKVSKPGNVQVLDAKNFKLIAEKEIPQGGAFEIAFARDGQTIAVGTNGPIKFIDLISEEEQLVLNERVSLRGHLRRATALAVSSYGKSVVTASSDGSIRKWDIDAQPEPSVLLQKNLPYLSVALSPDHRTLVAGCTDRTVTFFDLVSGTQQVTNPIGKNQPFDLKYSNDGKLLAITSFDEPIVTIWDTESRIVKFSLRGHQRAVQRVAFSPDNRLVATASKDGTVKIWDVESKTCRTTLEGDAKYFADVAFSPDGKSIAAGGCLNENITREKIEGGQVRIWDVDSGTCQHVLSESNRGPFILAVYAIAFSPDGKWLAAASYNEPIALWNMESLARVPVNLSGHGQAVSRLTFTPDSQTLLSASKDGTVKLWDVALGQEKLTLKGHTDYINAMAFSQDSQLLVTAGQDGTVRLWRAPRNETVNSRDAISR